MCIFNDFSNVPPSPAVLQKKKKKKIKKKEKNTMFSF